MNCSSQLRSGIRPCSLKKQTLFFKKKKSGFVVEGSWVEGLQRHLLLFRKKKEVIL